MCLFSFSCLSLNANANKWFLFFLNGLFYRTTIMRKQQSRKTTTKKTTGCIACGMRQRTIEKLDRILSLSTNHEEKHVFLRTEDTQDHDTLIYDPSHRLYQHFIKNRETYERITVDQDVYSINLFQQFLQELLSSTLDEDTLRYYEQWDVLFRCLNKKQSFWCSIRFEELFGVESKDHDVLHRSEKKKKIIFHFTEN